MQVCTSLQTDNHASTPPLSLLQVGCPSCRPTNRVKALKENEATENEEKFPHLSHLNISMIASFPDKVHIFQNSTP